MCACVCVCVYMLVHVCAATVIVYKQIWYHHYLGKQWGGYKAPRVSRAVPWGSDGILRRYPGWIMSHPRLSESESWGEDGNLSFLKVPQMISVDWPGETLC